MFSRRRTNSKSDSLPSTKRSFASRLKPLFRFQRSNQTTTRNVYVQQPPLNGVYPPSVPSHQFALPVSPSPQTPFGLPPTPQGVYSAPRMGFSPVIPLPESPSPFVRRTDHLPFSPARPAVHLQMAGLQPTSLSRRGQWLDPMLGSIPEHMHVAMHSPRVHPPSKMSSQPSSSRQAPHLGLQTFPSVSVGAVESSLHGHAHAAGLRHNTTRSVDHATLSGRQHEHEYEQQFWFPNRRSKPLSPEYLATPLSDNPLGLSGMVPVESYYTSRSFTVPQVPNQSAGQSAAPRREWDAYRHHSVDTQSSRGDTSRASQEYSSRNDRHVSTARSRPVTANSPPYQATAPNETMSPTYPASLRSSQTSGIHYLAERPVMDLYSPLRLMPLQSAASTSSRSYAVHDRRSTHPAYRGH